MIILGAVTIAFGACCFFLLVDSPSSKFLRVTPEEREVMKLRTLDNATVVTREVKFSHIIEAIKEPRFYCFIFASLLFNLQNGALNTFQSIITAGFGFSVRINNFSIINKNSFIPFFVELECYFTYYSFWCR